MSFEDSVEYEKCIGLSSSGDTPEAFVSQWYDGLTRDNTVASDKIRSYSHPVVYITGPITGIENNNAEAFNKVAEKLRNKGFTVLNPVETDGGSTHRGREWYLRQDFIMVARSTALVAIDGWENSAGAVIEMQIANALGIPIAWHEDLKVMQLNFNTKVITNTVSSLVTSNRPFTGQKEIKPELVTENILEEANRLVHGDRGADYGGPLDDFTRTGKIWGAILGTDPIAPELVGLCMMGVKISREVNKPKRDNMSDAAGYAETVRMVYEERLRRQEALKNAVKNFKKASTVNPEPNPDRLEDFGSRYEDKEKLSRRDLVDDTFPVIYDTSSSKVKPLRDKHGRFIKKDKTDKKPVKLWPVYDNVDEVALTDNSGYTLKPVSDKPIVKVRSKAGETLYKQKPKSDLKPERVCTTELRTTREINPYGRNPLGRDY